MKVLLRNPRRELEVAGPMQVLALLDRLELNRESVLVVRGDTLVPGDALLADGDAVEIRPVISGGEGPLMLRSEAEQRRGPPASAQPEFVNEVNELECAP